MAAIVNDIDRLLAENPAPPETGALDRALLIASSSPGGFKLASNGAASPLTIDLSAVLINLPGTVAWSAPNGVSLTVDGNAASLDAVDMAGDSAGVTASITYNGVLYERSIVINKVRDGASASSEGPPDLSAPVLLDTLTNQLTESQLYSALRTRINLIDAGPSVPGSVGARILAETNARNDAIATEASTRNTQFANFSEGVTTYVQQYAYSKSSSDFALSSLANTLRSEFSSNNGATTAWVQEYAYSKAQTNTAIAQSTSTLSTTVNQHTTSIQTQATSIDGLSAQITTKIDNNGYVSGYGLASTPINGVPTSSFIILADRFAVALPGQAPKFPFVIGTVAGQTVIGLRGDMVLDGSLTIRKENGQVILDAGKSLAEQTASNPNLLPALPSWTSDGTPAWLHNDSASTISLDGWHNVYPKASQIGNGLVMRRIGGLKLEPNTTYTLSFRASADAPGCFMTADLFPDSLPESGFAVATSHQRHVFTWTTPNNNDMRDCSLRIFGGGMPGQVLITDVKLERGAAATQWCDSVITPFNADVRMASAAIKLAHIDRATIGNLAALVAYLGNVQLGVGGALWTGQSAYDTGVGLRLGTNAADDPYFSARSGNGNFVRIRPATNTFEWNGGSIAGTTISQPTYDSFTLYSAGGGAVSGPNGALSNSVTLTISGNNGPHKVVWNLTRLAGGIPSTAVFMDASGNTASVSATANNTTINVQVSAVVTGADGRTLNFSDVMSLTFGSA